MTATETNTLEISWNHALRIWWGVTWRQIVIALLLGAGLAVVSLLRSEPDSMSTALTESRLESLISTIVGAMILMIAIRQTLLANYTTFSLTVLEKGTDEPGRIHAALGVGRMVRIWWAASWPLFLLGNGGFYLAEWQGLVPSGAEADPSATGCGMLIALVLAWIGMSVVFLRRALRKRYSDFRIVALKPWVEQVHA